MSELRQRAGRDYKQLLGSLEGKDFGRASCDMAEDYWCGHLSNDYLIELLQSDSDAVRGAAAWAVSDQCIFSRALVFLLDNASSDSCIKVRRSAVAFLVRCKALRPEDKILRLREFLEDSDSKTCEIVAKAISGIPPIESVQ